MCVCVCVCVCDFISFSLSYRFIFRFLCVCFPLDYICIFKHVHAFKSTTMQNTSDCLLCAGIDRNDYSR